jgi:hypothetical protein
MVRKALSVPTLRKLTERACNDPQRMRARKTEAEIMEKMPSIECKREQGSHGPVYLFRRLS